MHFQLDSSVKTRPAIIQKENTVDAGTLNLKRPESSSIWKKETINVSCQLAFLSNFCFEDQDFVSLPCLQW